MTGLRFGRLVGVSFSHVSLGGRAQWLFLCDCGAETIADGGNVRAGSTASCGCLHREISAVRLTIHGHRAGKRHGPTYRAWQLMNDHCGNPMSGGWQHNGAKGIAVTPRWRGDFPAFLADMGERPACAVLARVDAEANFSAANCYWLQGRSRAERAIRGARDRQRGANASRQAGLAPMHVEPIGGFRPDQSGARTGTVISPSAIPERPHVARSIAR